MLYNYDPLTFRLLSVSRITWQSGNYSVLPRAYGALAFRVKGTGRFRIGDRSFEVAPGEVIFLPAGVGYDVEYTDGEIIVIHFLDCSYSGDTENYSFSDPAFFYERFVEILRVWEERHSVYATCALVYSLLDAMRENKTRESVGDDVFRACRAIIDERFCDPSLSISGICLECGVSESDLRRKFHRFLGLSPKEYMLRIRVSHAMKLLAEGTHSVYEIAFACGFSDEKYFSRVIREEYGESPSRLMRKFGV